MALIVGGMNLTALNFALKELYTGERIYELTYKDHPLLALISKFEKFGGKYLRCPVVFNRPTGRSADFASARANRSPTDGIEFLLTRAKDYAFIEIDHETLMASKDDPMSFLEAKTLEVDGMLEEIGRSLALALYGNGSGVRGEIDATTNVATTTVILADPNDIVKFEKDQVIRLSDADDGTGVVKVGELQIRSIDADAGTFVVDVAINTVAGAATGDFLSIDGDYGAMLKGLASWLPGQTLPAGNFFGVDRSVYKQRLAGVWMDGTGGSLEEVLIDLLAKTGRHGGKTGYVLMNDVNFAALAKSQSSKIVLNDPGSGQHVNLGFESFSVIGPKGKAVVLADKDCPADKLYALQTETWKLNSLGRAPSMFDTDGLTMIRSSDSDSVEMQAYYYAQMGCRAPGYNGVADITPAEFT